MRWLWAIILAGMPVAPSASAAEVWRELGAWTVWHDAEARGCRAERAFETTAFAIGFDRTGAETAIVVRLSDPDWAGVAAGESYEVEAAFGQQAPWTLEMDGAEAGTLILTVPTRARMAGLFIDEFKREAAMAWRMDGETLGEFSLLGSRNAFDAVVACQSAEEGF